ncbi:uncharacterized protein SPAPADRAFT_65953 [Spathaspora passalidarum NRRL Y-27907]|uniref:Peptidase S8/S53 domain-containing protein n=1 Tax=Spathaspora passalidarum (strain NRRL Y-27907 / 11-Y1) TaxID=619300 RepID=G3AKH9_SPAPN|nr:uncharacterized protein SPAPADRAFT_65953 [Spathaspora passalidarum NRRL Y-27907]EGW32936.1 hypothetical protein SPAPADRAFT_65953 [Spathaspora passalidarum NRRL Y-27907]
MLIKSLFTTVVFTTVINALLIRDTNSVAANGCPAPRKPEKRKEPSIPKHLNNSANGVLSYTEDVIPNQYIVVLKDDLSEEESYKHRCWVQEWYSQMSDVTRRKGSCKPLEFFKLDDSFHGYSGNFPDELIKQVVEHPNVAFVERDSKWKLHRFTTEKDAPWGLSRVSHRDPVNYTQNATNEFDFTGPYLYDDKGGTGVTAYVLDTGIKTDLEEFQGRASWGVNLVYPNFTFDVDGHGTHVAGTIGSKTYGVAKNTKLVAVCVLNSNGGGEFSTMIKGVEWVIEDHKKAVKAKKKGFKGSVLNISIGGGISQAFDQAVNTAAKAGIHVVVSAGNEHQDACNQSPARAEGVVAVGAINYRDEMAWFTNYGKCVDIFAPGENITSTSIYPPGTEIMSGSSMATPHVTGIMSYYLSLQPDIWSEFSTGLLDPEDLRWRLLKYGTKDKIKLLEKDSPNLLPYNGGGRDLTMDFWMMWWMRLNEKNKQ